MYWPKNETCLDALASFKCIYKPRLNVVLCYFLWQQRLNASKNTFSLRFEVTWDIRYPTYRSYLFAFVLLYFFSVHFSFLCLQYGIYSRVILSLFFSFCIILFWRYSMVSVSMWFWNSRDLKVVCLRVYFITW